MAIKSKIVFLFVNTEILDSFQDCFPNSGFIDVALICDF